MLNQATKEFIKAHRNNDPRELALKAKRYPDVDMREAVTQIEGWQTAREKLPTWAATEGIIYPPRISMEQCSSEATALYKASITAGESFADLTGGFGIDCSYMARRFKQATYIERNTLLCSIAKENFALLGLDHIKTINANSEEILPNLPQQGWIFIDPARRDSAGRKVFALNDCEPDITLLEEMLIQKADKVIVKCSPMLDITAARRELHRIEAIHIVALNNECKELLFILGKEHCDEIPVTCANIHKGTTEIFRFTTDEEENSTTSYTDSIGKYLYEPNAAVQKSGCTHTLSQRFCMSKLHPNSQLYTADALTKEFPGRIFCVEKVSGFSKNEIKELQAMGQANITVRNFPESVQQLRKKLKLADGGDNYIFATTTNSGKFLILCKKVK